MDFEKTLNQTAERVSRINPFFLILVVYVIALVWGVLFDWYRGGAQGQNYTSFLSHPLFFISMTCSFVSVVKYKFDIWSRIKAVSFSVFGYLVFLIHKNVGLYFLESRIEPRYFSHYSEVFTINLIGYIFLAATIVFYVSYSLTVKQRE